MARKVLILAALAGLSLVPAAYAHGIATISVPEAAYQPGADVVVQGQFVDPEIAALAAPATVTLGIDGPVVGLAPIAADGTWTLTFALPQGVPLGTYVLAASVLNPDGGLVTPLLARAQLVVGTPAPAPADATASAPSLTEESAPLDTLRRGGAFFAAAAPAVSAVAPRPANGRVVQPAANPRSTLHAAPVVRARSHVRTTPLVRARPHVRTTRIVHAAPTLLARPVVASPAPVVAAPRVTPVVPHLQHATPARPPTPITPAHAISARGTPTVQRHSTTPWLTLLLAAGGLLLLLNAAGTWALLRARRHRTLAAIEAELQALLAAELAPEDAREPVSV